MKTGDITRPDLGLDPADRDPLLAEADTLFHLAAVYDLAMSRPLGMKVNVEGTERVNEFAARMEALERYHYVSTAFVAGRRNGVIREDELDVGQSFRNHYEETKFLAEKAVVEHAGSLPVSIYRPGVVVGHSETGYTIKYDGPYMALRLVAKSPGPMGRMNFGCGSPFNIVPVDYVVRALVAIAEKPDTVGGTFHLTDPPPLTSHEISEIFCRLMTGKSTWLSTPTWVLRLLAATPLLSGLLGLPRQSIPYFYSRLDFEASGAQRALEGTGVACPRLADYAPALIDYFKAHPTPGA